MNTLIVCILLLITFAAGYALGCCLIPDSFKLRLASSYRKGKRDGASGAEIHIQGYRNYVAHLQRQVDRLEQQVRSIT
jgi:hypothetical protein